MFWQILTLDPRPEEIDVSTNMDTLVMADTGKGLHQPSKRTSSDVPLS